MTRGYVNFVRSAFEEDFQVGMRVRADRLDALELDLQALEGLYPRMQRVELRSNPGESSVMALLAFGEARHARPHEKRIEAIASRLGAEVYVVANLAGESLDDFERRCEAMTLRASGNDTARAIAELKRVFARATPSAVPTIIRLAYKDRTELLAAWVRHVSEGALWVPTTHEIPRDELQLVFVAGNEEFRGNTAYAVPRTPVPNQSGFWLTVTPGPKLRALIDDREQDRRLNRRSEGLKGTFTSGKVIIAISSLPDLEEAHATDLGRGSLFVACTPAPELKTRVQVELTLPITGEEVRVTADVVNRVLSGPRPGVRLQIVDGLPELKKTVEELLAAHQKRRPKVLVVDDEAIWRSTLGRALTELGADVQLAADGRQAMLKLIEGYFDLDLVVLDLHMPQIDGVGLLERVRGAGGDSALKIFLFSAAGPDELAAVAKRGLATEVLSKNQPLDELTGRIARTLGLEGALLD